MIDKEKCNIVLKPKRIYKRTTKHSRTITLEAYDYNEIKLEKSNEVYNKYHNLRNSIIEWLYIINLKLQDHPSTLFHCISLFDRFVSKKKNVNQSRIDLYAAVCYFISKKLNEVLIVDLSFIHNIILKSKYSKKEIAMTELEICRELRFNLMFDTVQTYSDYFISKMSDELQSVFANIILFFNVFAQNFEEFTFDIFPITVAIITFKTSVEFLFENNKITQNEHERIIEAIDLFISSKSKVAKKKNIIEEYSFLLKSTFVNNINTIEHKEYSKLYKSAFDETN